MKMYGIYNTEMIEKLNNTIHHMHTKLTLDERLFVGKLYHWYQWYLSEEGPVHYAITSILYITILRKKYIKIYENFIYELMIYTNVIRVLSKGYLKFSHLPPMRLKEILNEVKKTIQITKPDYNIMIKRLHLYYDMKLVTFDIKEERNLIFQFPIFIEP